MIAVCICTCGRNAELRACLEAVAAALHAHPPGGGALVVVADNAPGGGAEDVVAELAARFPCPLVAVREPQPGISFARNTVLREALARGADAVACLDDDDVPQPDWLHHLEAAWRASGAELVFGGWNWCADVRLAPWQEDLKIFRTPAFEGTNRWGLPSGAGTFNVLVARPLIERLAARGPVFAPEFALSGGEDVDFMIRAVGAGATHAVAPRSVVLRSWDAERLTFAGVMRRAFRVGNLRALHDRNHDDPRRWRKKRRRIARALLAEVASLPWRLGSRKRLAAWAFEVTRLAGEVYGRWFGGRFQYYAAPRRRAVAGGALTR
ncbi:MAG: hypothetical protein DCC71_02230 [Proteobacteria bacterium]|nr:MAG: hypothetical protein DCC71_02230 [Pseudomonadota bacterium]